MNKNIMIITLIVTHLVLSVKAEVQHVVTSDVNSDDYITWAQSDFPPYIILKGKNKGKGVDDLVINSMTEELTDYKHRFQESNYKRVLQSMKLKKHMLVTPLFKTVARQKFVLYPEVASYLVLPNGFLIKKAAMLKFLPYLTEEGTLDLEQLLTSDDEITVGMSTNRSFAGIIDEMIIKYGDTDKFLKQMSSDLSRSLIQMLNKNRIDGMFAFPIELKYICEEENIDPTEFQMIPIEGMVSFSKVYFGAPKSEWGETVIGKINTILNKPGTIAQYVSFYESWLDGKSKENYKKVLKEYYGDHFPLIYSTLSK